MNPSQIGIPSSGISDLKDRPFAVEFKVTNDSMDNFLLKALSFTVIEDDSVGTGFNDTIGTFTQADTDNFEEILIPMMSMRTFTVTGFTLSESSLESSADGSGDNAGDNLEFFIQNAKVSGDFIPKPVPEPLTILGAGMAVAFGAGFKRKIKRSNSLKK
ncbi:MAG: PEP-CTERM sorting domain-containing protein [Crocosphaera sp.]|nr:PEP-CTERM sorting domain-containing protein [Crocosphaera sp.]